MSARQAEQAVPCASHLVELRSQSRRPGRFTLAPHESRERSSSGLFVCEDANILLQPDTGTT
jgi:hypothetical protein